MVKPILAVLVLVLTLSAVPSATTCAAPNQIPAGAAVTTNCTYIVEQVDPGVWRDNLNQIWTFITGLSTAIRVKLADLHIGR